MAHRNRTIPDDDHNIIWWVRTFAQRIAIDPAVYGFTPEDADLLDDLAAELTEKYIIARRPDTRTRPTIRAKNDCRKKTLDVFRSYVRRVNANPDITNEQKTALGIVIAERRSSPVPAPDRGPALWVTTAGPGVHELGYWRGDVMIRRHKPHGVSHMVLLCAIGDRAVDDPAKARYAGSFTRWPIRVRQKPEDSGKTATYFGAWVTGSGRHSNWSAPVSLVIAFGQTGLEGAGEAQLREAA